MAEYTSRIRVTIRRPGTATQNGVGSASITITRTAGHRQFHGTQTAQIGDHADLLEQAGQERIEVLPHQHHHDARAEAFFEEVLK